MFIICPQTLTSSAQSCKALVSENDDICQNFRPSENPLNLSASGSESYILKWRSWLTSIIDQVAQLSRLCGRRLLCSLLRRFLLQVLLQLLLILGVARESFPCFLLLLNWRLPCWDSEGGKLRCMFTNTRIQIFPVYNNSIGTLAV